VVRVLAVADGVPATNARFARGADQGVRPYMRSFAPPEVRLRLGTTPGLGTLRWVGYAFGFLFGHYVQAH